MTQKEFAPVTPGEMLKEEFLGEYGLSQNQLAGAAEPEDRRRKAHQGTKGRATFLVAAVRCCCFYT